MNKRRNSRETETLNSKQNELKILKKYNMDTRLAKFLQTKEVNKDEPFTHTSKIKPLRRYYIDDESEEEFFDIYNQVIEDGGIAGLTERPENVVPLIVDIDFRTSLDNGLKRQYKPRHVRDIVSIYQEIIEEIAENPEKKNIYFCCVLEKSGPSSYQGKCKDGFHLHFPYFYTEKWVQKEYIRPEVIRRVQERKVLADLQFLEPLSKVFDENIPNVCWLMYGSRKEPKAEAYKMTRRYNRDMELLPVNTMFKNKYSHGSRIWNLPRYLSIRHDVEATPLKEHVKRKKPARNRKRRELQRSLDVIYSDLIEAEQLMDMLNPNRADEYGKWIEVGWILYNISEGEQKGLEAWINFSSKSEKFEEGACEKHWDKMEVRGYTLASLKHMARNDSPDEFRDWKSVQIDHKLEEGLRMAHNDIAKILHIMFENQFVCADVEKDIWYEFRTHRWERVARGITLRQHISLTLSNKYSELGGRYYEKFRNTEEPEQRQMYNSKCQMINKLIDKLKNSSFKTCVMKEATEYFYDKNFIERMDENPNLLVCENGVYDAANKEFRDGRPDDYCTKSTGLYYNQYEHDDPRVQELEEIFRKTFVNQKLLKFFKQTVSDLIRGGNRHKIFVIWTGAGDNGKSVCADLLEKAFGEYYYTPPTTMLTGRQTQSDSATAALMPCKGARIVVISETDNSDVLNCGTMKKLTGGDPFYARGLFKEPVKIIPHFKLILHCNKLPNVSAEDKASWNRIRVLPYESTFVKKHLAPGNKSEQFSTKTFPMDKSLKDKLNDLAEPFLWWMIKAFEEFGDADLYEPPEVKSATDSYQKTNDFYMQFIDERILETKNEKDKVSMTMVYTFFKDWYKDSFPGCKIPARMQVRESLEKKMGKQNKGVWYGYIIYDPEAEDSGSDSGNDSGEDE